jgi:hypothetical protein
MAVPELNNLVAGFPKETQYVFTPPIFRVKLDAAPIGVLPRRGDDGKLLYRFNFSDTA